MPTRQPRRSHEQWQSFIEKFKNQADLTQQQFCQAEGLSLGTFRKHLYRSPSGATRARKQNPSLSKSVHSRSGPGSFGPVTIRDTEHLPEGSCLELPGNIRLHTQSMPSAEFLHNLVKVLGHEH